MLVKVTIDTDKGVFNDSESGRESLSIDESDIEHGQTDIEINIDSSNNRDDIFNKCSEYLEDNHGYMGQIIVRELDNIKIKNIS